MFCKSGEFSLFKFYIPHQVYGLCRFLIKFLFFILCFVLVIGINTEFLAGYMCKKLFHFHLDSSKVKLKKTKMIYKDKGGEVLVPSCQLHDSSLRQPLLYVFIFVCS